MRIRKIVLENFRQYYDEVIIDFGEKKNNNLYVIGGKNGYGKTNLLIALVWCLYGENISQIDDVFRKEIRKEGGYSKFLKQALNWDAAKEGKLKFKVTIHFEDVEFPENPDTESDEVQVIREYDTETYEDELFMRLRGNSSEILMEKEDKINFINDYLVPIEAARFVFFDAEKIATMAELSIKEEGNVLNDALGKILGLDVYEALREDIEINMNNLRKQSAGINIKDQLNSTENSIKINLTEIEKLEEESIKIDENIIKLSQKVRDYEAFIASKSSKDMQTNLALYYQRKKELQEKDKAINKQFSELSEILPLAILAGKLEEVILYISQQEEQASKNIDLDNLIEKKEDFIEDLFNKPEFPERGDISFEQKMFYAQKAGLIFDRIFSGFIEKLKIDFEFDLSNSEINQIKDVYNQINRQSKYYIEQTIINFNQVRNELDEIEKKIRKIESEQVDDELLEYSNRKNEAEKQVIKLKEDNAINDYKIKSFIKENEKLNQLYQALLRKVEVSKARKIKFEKLNNYINTLNAFMSDQKDSKSKSLAKSILSNLKTLMHKLNDDENHFITNVAVEILPDNAGLKVNLYDAYGNILPKESLSQGEKQLYISSLIKAILAESIQNFPIIIDTPLGKLDEEHINNVLKNFYPNLAEQVIIMATNNELPQYRFKVIEDMVAQSYLLQFNDNKTTIEPGYFMSYEN